MFYFWSPKTECIPSSCDTINIQKEKQQQFFTHYSKENCLTQILNELDFYLIWVFICRDKKQRNITFYVFIFSSLFHITVI